MKNSMEENFENYPSDNYAVQMLQKCLSELNENSRILYKKKLLLKNDIDVKLLNRKGAIKQNHTFIEELVEKFEDGSEVQKKLLDAFTGYKAPSSESTHWLKNIISNVNNHRLDGVWSRNMIETLLSLGLMVSTDLKALCACVNLINGVSSYGFYFVRGGLDILKLGNHTLVDNPKYGSISTFTKLKVQWEMRYSCIVNDVPLWGLVNYLTFHVMDSYAGNITTAVLLLADLLHTVYQKSVETHYFEKLKEDLGNDVDAKNMLVILHDRQMLNYNLTMLYQFFLLSSFITLCSFFAATASVPLTLTGAAGCLILQLGINLKDHYIKLSAEQDGIQCSIIRFKMITRVVLQLLLPAMFTMSAFYLMPIVANPIFMTTALLAVSERLINLMNNLNELYEAYKTKGLVESEVAKIDKDIRSTPVLKTGNSNLDDFKTGKIAALTQQRTNIENRYAVAQSKLMKDSLISLSGIGLITMAATVLSCGITPCLAVLAVASVSTYALGINFDELYSIKPSM